MTISDKFFEKLKAGSKENSLRVLAGAALIRNAASDLDLHKVFLRSYRELSKKFRGSPRNRAKLRRSIRASEADVLEAQCTFESSLQEYEGLVREHVGDTLFECVINYTPHELDADDAVPRMKKMDAQISVEFSDDGSSERIHFNDWSFIAFTTEKALFVDIVSQSIKTLPS